MWLEASPGEREGGGTMAYQRGIPRLAEGSASPPEGEKRNDSNNVEQEQTEVLCTGFCA